MTSYRVPMGDSPFGKRFILLFYLSLVGGHSIRVKLDNPSKCYSQISTITRSSCSCSVKAHQDSRPIGLHPSGVAFRWQKEKVRVSWSLELPCSLATCTSKCHQLKYRSYNFFFFLSLVAPGEGQRGVAQAPSLARLTLGPALLVIIVKSFFSNFHRNSNLD